MLVENLLKVLKENSYLPMNTNIRNMGFFYTDIGETMNIAVIVNNYGNTVFSAEQLKEIAFQVERKFLLKGKRCVNIQYILLSDNVDRDRKINETEDIHFWIVDMIVNRLIVYENEQEEFEELQKSIESEIINMEMPQKKEKVRISYVNIFVILINVIIFIAMEVNGSTLDTEYMVKCGAARWQLIFHHQEYYRLFTCMFLHFGFAHLINNMFSLAVIGNEVEKMYGKLKYLIIYIFSGVGASLLSAVYYMKIGENVVSAGASGAIFGIIGAMFIGLYRSNRIDGNRIGSRFILLLIMALYSGSMNVDNMAHLGGFITGTLISVLYIYLDMKKGSAKS